MLTRLPKPDFAQVMRLPMQVLPNGLQAAAISRGWNHLTRGQRFDSRMADLEGTRIAVVVSDTDARWQFQVRVPHLYPIRPEAGWDVRVSGSSDDLLRLALGLEDADTLFFNRRLSMEGDTAAGVYLKNFLDGLELDWAAHAEAVVAALPAPLQGPARDAVRRLDPERRLPVLRDFIVRNWLGEEALRDPLAEI